MDVRKEQHSSKKQCGSLPICANLRQPAEVLIEKKNAYAEAEIIQLLELQDLSDAIVYCLGVEF